MKECLSEDILQQYFDGELPDGRMESVASHLAGCNACAASFRELEGETDLLMSALAPEFDVVVPSERLHKRIDAAIAGIQVVSPVYSRPATSRWRGWLESITGAVSFSPQRAFGYASLAAVLAFAAIYGLTWRHASPVVNTTETAQNGASDKLTSAPIVQTVAAVAKPDTHVDSIPPKTPTRNRSPKLNRTVVPDRESRPATATEVAVKLIPGERSYLKTIAELDKTIKSGDKSMRPALQAEYERNLALVDRAIAATRSAAKRNPNDPDAAEFMFSAYQSKVDLLNTIADARVYNRTR